MFVQIGSVCIVTTEATPEITTLVNLVQLLADIEDELGLDRDDIDDLVNNLLQILLSEFVLLF